MLSKLAPVQSNFSAAMNQGVIREDYLTAPFGQLLICSIKAEVKKKHISFGWKFSCFSAHLSERDLF
jgi:hypothetical protein